jgi:carbamoylphosphate synthase small subunit
VRKKTAAAQYKARAAAEAEALELMLSLTPGDPKALEKVLKINALLEKSHS